MRSSPEHARLLFNNWKENSSPIFVVLVTGETNIGFLALVEDESRFPFVRFSVLANNSRVFLKGLKFEATFDFTGVDDFEYSDAREAPAEVSVPEPKLVCALRVNFPSGDGATFGELVSNS